MLIFLLTLLHVVVCVFLILVVLLQTGKGSDIAAAFGGSSQTAFGARGATTFLSKMTTVSAGLFCVTSMSLAMVSSSGSSSVVEDAPGAVQSGPAEAGAPAELPAETGDGFTMPADDISAPDTSGADADTTGESGGEETPDSP